MDDTEKSSNLQLFAVGAAIGAAYGLGLRGLVHLSPRLEHAFVMTAGFTCFMPFGMGWIVAFITERRRPQRVLVWLFLPWVAVGGALAGTMITMLEGSICVAMFAPLALVLSLLGGLIGGVTARTLRSRRARNFSMSCVLLLPVLVAYTERPALHRTDARHVENIIDISAAPQVVWRNVERVPRIRPDEIPKTWAGAIGFPGPLEATLSHEGIGGVRNASFAGGLEFVETVDTWELEHRLGFSIVASKVPKTTLDEHVRVGGPFFDVLRGEYRLERLPDGRTRLHLSSQHRLSTDFNWYSHLWTDGVMSDLQGRILLVVKKRSEAESGATVMNTSGD